MVKKMKKDLMYSWFVNNLMYITNKEVPIEGFDVLLQLNEENLHSDLVKQDVLILTGRNDHLVPFKMHNLQIKALTNAKSVTERVFTKEENAQNHCQMGNLGLALDVMLKCIFSGEPYIRTSYCSSLRSAIGVKISKPKCLATEPKNLIRHPSIAFL